MYIKQFQLSRLKEFVQPGKVAVVYGPRRCGKTTLLNHFIAGMPEEDYLFVTGEDIFVAEHLSSRSVDKLRSFVGNRRYLIVDEAQKIRDIGLNLKLIVDHLPQVSVIATGSSAFDLARQAGEPLTGRKYTLCLYPLAQLELGAVESAAQSLARLESRLVYGSYPDVVLADGDERRRVYLRELVSSYLYKDILELEGIRHADKLVRLLQSLAFQIGKEVSVHELGTRVGLSKNTVERYLDLLQKAFVIYALSGFSRNLRSEVVKTRRYYFYDNGVRNGLINNFNLLTARNDEGMLWENYVVMERLKKQEYTGIASNNYFWRTYERKEIDWVEEREGRLFGYEIKWGSCVPRVPKLWADTYPEAEYMVVNRDTYLSFIT